MFKLVALVSLTEAVPVEDLLGKARRALQREPLVIAHTLAADAGHTQHATVKPASFAFMLDFRTAEDWKRYVAGPIHEELNQLFLPWRTGAIGMQYEA